MTTDPPLSAALLAAIPLADEAIAAWLRGCAVGRERYERLLTTATGNAALSQFEHRQVLWHDIADETYAVIGVESGGRAYYAIPLGAEPPGIAEARRQRQFFQGKPKEGGHEGGLFVLMDWDTPDMVVA